MFDVIRNTVNAFTRMHIGPWRDLGDTLLVGEGNLSFSRSLLRQPAAQIAHMTATTYETRKELSEEARQNVALLKHNGVLVIHGVDATHLEKDFRRQEFDTIIFQFPNVGSRDSKYGRNPNHVMVCKFLYSAAFCLKPSGKILISAVDSPHYQGAFRFDDAAVFAGYETPEIHPFDPSIFSGYSHTNTNDDESALDDHSRFATWVFKLSNEPVI